MSALKKCGPAFYAYAVSMVLGIAGMVTMCLCHTMDTGNPLNTFGRLVAFAAAALIMIVGAIWASNRPGSKGILQMFITMAAIMLLTSVIGTIINSRILLISGLFSWNSQNMIGWRVFYMSIASIVCYVAANIALIVGSFLKK